MRDLRVVKTPDEMQALRDVGAAIDAVHAAVPGLLRAGRTEAEVGRDIAELILEDHDEVNFVIVASGPNGASPHHETGDRVLEPGDAVVVDIGGTRAGYCSDSTRDYAIGHLPEGYAELHAVLEEAQELAVRAVRPGVTAASIDAAARDHIAAAGYGDRFVHRTGHGIGVEEHEEPWIVASNTEPVAAGMAFSVEPGIYVPGRYGSRIEDIVVVTEDGVERVNHRPREVLVV
jgi:Xaa-Pro aminopeptidase